MTDILCLFFKEGENHVDQTTENLNKVVTLVNTNIIE